MAITPSYQKRMDKDPKLVWLEPDEMEKAHKYSYTATKKELCDKLQFSESTFKRYIHTNVEHVYDYTSKRAHMLYDREKLFCFIAEHVVLEQRVKFVCIENYIENWKAYTAALDEIDEQYFREMREFAEHPVDVNGELLTEGSDEYQQWQSFIKRYDEGSKSLRFSPTREEPTKALSVVQEFMASRNIERRVRRVQREHVNDAARDLMNVPVEEWNRAVLPWVDITESDDELIQVTRASFINWDMVTDLRQEGESDEQLQRRLFRGTPTGAEYQAYIRVTLQMPDGSGNLGKRIYYTPDPVLAKKSKHRSPGSLFPYMRTGYEAFIRSGLAL